MPETAWRKTLKAAGAVWCFVMHDSVMWPAHGEYRCRTCGQIYQVPWDENNLENSRRTTPSVLLPSLTNWVSEKSTMSRAQWEPALKLKETS